MKNSREYRLFSCSIYTEHIENASFLYEQRLWQFRGTAFSWQEFDTLEERVEAHIYGLEAGDEVALSVCRKQVVAGDAGELFAAVSIFCRQKQRDLLDAVLEDLDWGDEERVQAVTDALCWELPEDWAHELVPVWLISKESALVVVGCRLVAFRRLPFVEQVAALSAHEDDAVKSRGVWALAQCGAKDALVAFERSIILQALCGDSVVVDPQSEELIHALGICGLAETIPKLMDALSNESLAESAALALNLITGANLKEEIFIPEDIQEEDLFEEELEAFHAGTLYPEGEWPGETVTRLSQDAKVWQAWWDEHQETFSDAERYRAGVAFSKSALLSLLNAENTSNQVREWCGYELALLFDVNVPFDTMMRVKDQQAALAVMV